MLPVASMRSTSCEFGTCSGSNPQTLNPQIKSTHYMCMKLSQFFALQSMGGFIDLYEAPLIPKFAH